MVSVCLYIICGCLLMGLLGNSVMADADPPDAAKPGGAQAGQQFNAPVPPNMRRFLARPPVDPVEEQMPRQLKASDETHLSVSKIQLAGVVDRPELGILRAELEAFVE